MARSEAICGQGAARGPASGIESSLSVLPHPHRSQRERKNSLKGDTPRPRGKGGKVGGGQPFHSCSRLPASRGTCARPAEPLPAAPGAPADSGCPLQRDGGGGVGAGRAGRGGAAPPGLPRDRPALGAGNEEEAGGGSGGRAAAGTRAPRRSPSGSWQPRRARSLTLPGRQKVPGSHPSSPRPSGAPALLRALPYTCCAPPARTPRRGDTRALGPAP